VAATEPGRTRHHAPRLAVALTPTDPMASRLRPRGTSELIDALFALLREHYLAFLTIVAIGFAPVILATAVTAAVGGMQISAASFSAASLGMAAYNAGWTTVAVLTIVGLPCFMLVHAALIFAGSDAYLHDVVDVPDVLRRAAGAMPATLGAYLVATFLVCLGYVFLFVPGIYAYGALFALPPVILLESRGIGEGVSRSFALTKGRKRAILGTLFLTVLVVSIMQSMTGAIVGLAGPWAGFAAQMAVAVACYPVSTVMVVLLYYDVRIRAEGFDLEWEVAAMSAPAA
jgi:hypothetical protein